MLVVSGQVKRETYLRSYDLPDLRQLGDQEVDIISMVKGITKYAVTVSDPQTIRYHLERALHLATSGRPGPVWLDVPVDVQSSQVDEATPARAMIRPRTTAPWDMALIAAAVPRNHRTPPSLAAAGHPGRKRRAPCRRAATSSTK